MTRDEALAWLEHKGSRRQVAGLARYGIDAPRAFGVPVGTLLRLARQLGKDHALASQLWDSGWYEARMLAAMVGDPREVTRRQMDRWAAAFDNWAVCDTVCWHLFDHTPFAFEIGRRNRTLHAAAQTTARRLASSEDASCRWVGNDALRDLAKSQPSSMKKR
jgi:3-methyladenine DNA glycosylase AlkD